MTFTQQDFGTAFSRRTAITLQRAPTLLGLTNTDYEAEIRRNGVNQVEIQIPDWGSVGEVTETTDIADFNAKWGDPNVAGANQVRLTLGTELKQNDGLGHYEEMAIPWPVLERTRGRQANTMSLKIDDIVGRVFIGLAVTGAGPNAAGSGANGNAGPIASLGTIGTQNSVAIGGNAGTPFGSGPAWGQLLGTNALDVIGAGIQQAVEGYRMHMTRVFAILGVPMGGMPGELFALADPFIWRAYREYLRKENRYLESLNATLWTPSMGGIFAPGSRRYNGQWDGVDLIDTLSPSFQPAQTSDATKAAGWPILFGTRMAVTRVLTRQYSQYLTPLNNQIASRHELRQWRYLVMGLVNSQLAARATVASTKNDSDRDGYKVDPDTGIGRWVGRAADDLTLWNDPGAAVDTVPPAPMVTTDEMIAQLTDEMREIRALLAEAAAEREPAASADAPPEPAKKKAPAKKAAAKKPAG